MISLKRKVLLATFLLLPLIFLSGRIAGHNRLHAFEAWLGIPIASAREIENERENDDDIWEGTTANVSTPAATSSKTSKTKSKPIVESVVEYKPVTKSVSVVEQGFGIDTDKDGLVDALDPDPNVDQRQYFTDDDTDGVPNVWDKYPNEDDFSFLDGETDSNQNGLIDAYE